MAFKGDAFDINVAKTTIGANYFGTRQVILAMKDLLSENPNKSSIILNVCSMAGSGS